MVEDSTTSSWSIVDAAIIEEEDGSSLSTGVIVSTATEDDVISLFSTLDISDDDGISTSIATKSHPVVIPKCTSNLFQTELDALADSPDNDDHDDDVAMDSYFGTGDLRRQHTFKGMSYGDRWGESRRDRA